MTDILIAEDEPVSRHLLESALRQLGYQITVTTDGEAAWQVLSGPNPPALAILDWMMPGLDGLEICLRLRNLKRESNTYVLMLTGRKNTEDVVAGLDAGADDYMAKPFNREELRARVQVGMRMVGLQKNLAARVAELEEAMSRVKQLQGLLPICCYCKRIRDDGNYWQRLEEYFTAHSDARFSHSICPSCYDTVVRPDLENQFERAPAAKSPSDRLQHQAGVAAAKTE